MFSNLEHEDNVLMHKEDIKVVHLLNDLQVYEVMVTCPKHVAKKEKYKKFRYTLYNNFVAWHSFDLIRNEGK